VYDVSGSMNGLSQQSLSMLRAFFDYTHPEDEFFIMAFNNKPQLVQDFTSVPEEILNRVFYIPPKGSTSLYDAAYLATEKVKQGRHHKKALMIFSDGGENSSRYTSRELRNMLRETDVQIYTVGFGNGGVLEDIVEPTGGLTGFLNSSADAEHYYARLALLLRKQYVIGFYPTDATNKAPWHKVQVKLNAPKQMGPLTLSYRKGYPAF
jgi:Ca-activated chloride channel family protein